MVKTLWILSSRCRPRVGVEMSTLQVGDSGLGEGDEGGAGPGLLLGVVGLQCRPRVDDGEVCLPILELLEELQSSDCCSRLVIARTLDQRHLEVIVMVDKSVGFKPFGRSLLEEMSAKNFKNVFYFHHKHLII